MLAVAPWLETTLLVSAWTLVILLLVIGFAGTFLPIIPGQVMILLGAVAHRLFVRADNSIEWIGFAVLGALVALSFIVDFVSGAMGAKWFGASRWGAAGALIGGVVGLFFGLPGIIIGPIVGAIAAEIFFAKKKLKPATKSGAGTIIGATAGLVLKVVIAVWMIGWIAFDLLYFAPGR